MDLLNLVCHLCEFMSQTVSLILDGKDFLTNHYTRI
jgi:hypothetical protein